jgi:hypothetical protein
MSYSPSFNLQAAIKPSLAGAAFPGRRTSNAPKVQRSCKAWQNSARLVVQRQELVLNWFVETQDNRLAI